MYLLPIFGNKYSSTLKAWQGQHEINCGWQSLRRIEHGTHDINNGHRHRSEVLSVAGKANEHNNEPVEETWTRYPVKILG